MEIRLAFVGFGNVARAFARMIVERRAQLASQYGIEWRATAIATANHGCIQSGAGLDLSEAANRSERGDSLTGMSETEEVAGAAALIENCEADILFETTTLDPLGGEPATTYIRNALSRRISVVTANKGPVAFAYRGLKKLAADNAVSFRFEGTVMDGAPVFNLVEDCLPAVRVVQLAGALNSTTNLILTSMESGRSFDESLDEAKRAGIAEANADHDIDGWDSAIKAVALANVLMGIETHPQDVARQGIRNLNKKDLRAAARSGRTVRLISRARLIDEGVSISVAPEIVSLESPLGSVRGTSNVILIETDLMGEIAIYENEPGIEQTAYALLSDMVKVCEKMKGRTRRFVLP